MNCVVAFLSKKNAYIAAIWGCGGSVDIALASKSRLPTQQPRDRIRQPPERARTKDCLLKTNLGLGSVPTHVKKTNVGIKVDGTKVNKNTVILLKKTLFVYL
jgi:hypothetical protein